MAEEVYRTGMFRLSTTTQLGLFVIKLYLKGHVFKSAIKKGVGFVLMSEVEHLSLRNWKCE